MAFIFYSVKIIFSWNSKHWHLQSIYNVYIKVIPVKTMMLIRDGVDPPLEHHLKNAMQCKFLTELL